MRHLNTYVKGENIVARLQRMMPTYRRDLAVHTGIIDNILRPYILSRTHVVSQDTKPKAVIDLALGIIRGEDPQQEFSQLSSELVDIVISQLKLFILAGHHTTAQAM